MEYTNYVLKFVTIYVSKVLVFTSKSVSKMFLIVIFKCMYF